MILLSVDYFYNMTLRREEGEVRHYDIKHTKISLEMLP